MSLRNSVQMHVRETVQSLTGENSCIIDAAVRSTPVYIAQDLTWILDIEDAVGFP